MVEEIAGGQMHVSRKTSSVSPFQRAGGPWSFQQTHRSLSTGVSGALWRYQPGMLTLPRAQHLGPHILGTSWGKETWPLARQVYGRRGRACPFHSWFPGGPKADLPMTWPLRGVATHKLGGDGPSGWGCSGREDSAPGGALPDTGKASPGTRCVAGKALESALPSPSSLPPQVTSQDLPRQKRLALAAPAPLTPCPAPCSAPGTDSLGKTVCSASSSGTPQESFQGGRTGDAGRTLSIFICPKPRTLR